MELTEKRRKYIDGLSYEALLSRWRFAPVGDPWFEGETGQYWSQRMTQERSKPGGDEAHVSASKSLGWDRD